MNEATLRAIAAEIAPQLAGQKLGKIFQLSRQTLAIDFRLHGGDYLFVSIEPSSPRIYLINRKLKDLEKNSGNPSPFVLGIRKRLSNAIVRDILKDEGERILRFYFAVMDELGEQREYSLVAQLTGRSANLFLLDKTGVILDSMRENEGQAIGQEYSAPVSLGIAKGDSAAFDKADFETLSAALDEHYQNAGIEKARHSRIKSAEAAIKQEIQKREKLKSKLLADIANHGDAEKWKKYGDLLLANLATAKRNGNVVSVTDFYSDDQRAIDIELDENKSLTEGSEIFFAKYAKAKRAAVELEKRIESVNKELASLTAKRDRFQAAVAADDTEALAEFLPGEAAKPSPGNKPKKDTSIKGVRRYISSDGVEILVGKASRDNDALTFKIAKSLDFWLHAADYGGSHVVVRNPNRGEIPYKTLLEAAQLAAYFSQAKEQPKVAVHYTQKKFVNKPRGAAPGLVSLSSFKTILVEPKESLEKV